MNELSYPDLTERAFNDLRAKTEAAVGLFHLDECICNVDQEAGTIIFLHDNGVQARAPVQIIGTYNSSDGSWLWGWDHPSVLEPLRFHAEKLHQYGEANGIGELMERKLQCSEQDCWRFTALACLLNEAQGAYRGLAGTAYVFMTYGHVTLSKPGA